MDSNYLTSPLAFIITTLFDLYILVVLLRFILQMLRADFYNAVSQFIVKMTTPPLKVLRRFIPSMLGQDSAAIVLCLLIIYAKFLLLRALDIPVVAIADVHVPIGLVSYAGLLIYSIADLASLFISVFLVASIIQVVISWINPGQNNPVIGLVNTITAPILRPIQKRLPPMGGFDFSTMVAILALMIGKMLIIPPIIQLGSF
jgi:YggT family protein